MGELNKNKIEDVFESILATSNKINFSQNEKLILMFDYSEIFNESSEGQAGKLKEEELINFQETGKPMKECVTPEILYNENNSTNFYIFKEMINNKSNNCDILLAYFLSRALQCTQSVKIIYFLPYSMIKQSADKMFFFVEHATRFLNHMEPLKSSIGLVVSYSTENEDEPLEGIISTVTDFLIMAKMDIAKSQRSSSKSTDDLASNIKLVNFIDTMLMKERGFYRNICLAENPVLHNPLNSLLSLHNGNKIPVNYYVNNLLQFPQESVKHSFHLDLPEHIIDAIKKIEADMQNNFELEVAKISEIIIKIYETKEENSLDLTKLTAIFSAPVKTLNKYVQETSEDLEISITALHKELRMLDIDVPNSHFTKLLKYNKYLKVTHSVGKVQNLSNAQPLRHSLGGIKVAYNFLEQSERWLRFLNVLHNILSGFLVQKSRGEFNASNLIEQHIQANSNINLSVFYLKKFMDKIETTKNCHAFELAYNNIKNDSVNRNKIKGLIEILNTTLNYKIEESQPNSSTLVIKGNFIILSEVKRKLKDSFKYLEIHAINKIFIDEDLDMSGKKLLALSAPEIEIVGERKILLNGSSNQNILPKASPGSVPSGKGVDGAPGLPGENAGDFMVITGKVTGGNMIISAIGGKGGAGQDGGDGAGAEKGEDPPKWEIKKYWQSTSNDQDYIDQTWRFKGFKVACTKNKWTCRVYGKLAKSGGYGGSGGAGGKGGFGGKAIIVDLSKSNKFLHQSKEGQQGEAGKGGVGGPGASNGKWGLRKMYLFGENRYFFYSKLYDYGISSSGLNGTEGTNFQGIISPVHSSNNNLSFIINNFKNYVRDNLKRNMQESCLLSFLDKIEKHSMVANMYDTLGLVNELHGLEKQFFALQNHIPMQTFYQSLLYRIGEYARSPKEIDTDKNIFPEYKIVLSNLYSATLSKITSLISSKGDLIINIPEFLQNSLENIDKMKEMMIEERKSERYKEYSDKIIIEKEKIVNIANKKLRPEIDTIGKDLEKGLELAVQETQNKIEELKRNIAESEEKIDDLRHSIVMTIILGTVSTIGTAVITLGVSQIETLGNIIKVAAETGLIFNMKDQYKNYEWVNILKKMGDFTHWSTKFQRDGGIESLNATIHAITDKVKGKNVPIVLMRLHDLKEELKKTNPDASVILKELSKAVEKQNKIVEKETGQNSTLLDWIDFGCKLAPPILDAIQSIYLDIMDHRMTKEIINNLKEDIKGLETFQNKINKSMFNQLKDLEKDMDKVQKDLANKSHVELDVTKWEVQKLIKDIQYEVKSQLQANHANEFIMHSYESLDNTITTIINLYDRMVGLNDNSKLAEFILDLHSQEALEIKISNPQLQEAVSSLKIILKSNLVLEQYERAISAFSQYVFPFANAYLEELCLPDFKFNSTQDNLLSTVVDKIQIMRSKVIESKTTVGKYEKYMHRNILFSSEYPQVKPFFVWKYEQNKDTIKKLLEGEEITIGADINSGLQENAVKFNVIGINLKVHNDDQMQEELNKVLNFFQVTMVHSGNSHFKCGDEYFNLRTEELSFSYYIKKDSNGKQINTNLVYDKIANSEFMLSPYTLWKIKITNISEKYNFNNLKQFLKLPMDIELTGQGQYIDSNIIEENICSKNLKTFYKEDYNLNRLNKNSLIEESTHLDKTIGQQAGDSKGTLFSNILNFFKSNKWFTRNLSSQINSIINPNEYTSDEMNLKQIPKINQLDYGFPLVSVSSDRDKEKTLNFVNGDYFISHDNLLLWDLIARKFKGTQIKNKYEKKLPKQDDFNHNLAYSYYVSNS